MKGVQLTGREKPVPGCLGRMANLFDLTSAVAGNRLLTEKPHFADGSTLSRSRSDVTRMSSPVAEEMGNKMIVSKVTRSSSTKKLEGTPVKMLIAQELSKELESRHSSPNVVAKLMGLDAIPHQQQQQQLLPDLVHGRCNSKCHLRNCYSELPAGYWLQENGSFDSGVSSEVCHCQKQFNYKDIYEIRKPSTKTKCLGDVSPQKGKCNEKKMAHIRKKFMDAKRLSTDEKLRQTKEFQDALEVLSSNQDLFLKVLQEPSSLISHHLYGGQPIPPPTETKRITVLRPSKMVSNDKFPATGARGEKQVKNSPPVNQATLRVDESPTQPTRIVVLKPSSGTGRIQDVKAAAAVPYVPSSPRGNLQPNVLFNDPGECETQEAKEVAKEITQRLRENLIGLRRDETFISSMFSNGYTGDESSFSKSEDEFVGDLSDSEVMSPATRHCWDYINRYSSPYSCSSLGRVSFSPESSVAREAKKRLSERWTMMSSNGTAVEHQQVQRSSSTLGEMLALSDVKPEIFEVDDPERDQDPKVSTSCLTSHFGGGIQSPRNLVRSKSLPVTATSSGLRLDVEALDSEARKLDGSIKQTAKSTFRGKVTSLFFPRSKKLSNEKTDKSLSKDQALPNHWESSVPPVVQTMNRTLWAELNDEPGGLASDQVTWSTLKQASPGTLSENQDQPSPISVLEPPFEEDGSSTIGFSDATIPSQHGKHTSFTFGKSNLIDKSPAIGSIARTLMFDEPCAQLATSDLPKSSSGGAEDGEWLFLIQSLLSASGVESESQLSTNLTRWHSPESPLDPLLRENYVNPAAEDPLSGANRRQLRSKRRLVFDFVNATLFDMSGMGSNAVQTLHYKRPVTTPAGEALVDRVWAQMKDLLWRGGWEADREGEDGEDSGTLAAEVAVMKELAGREWDNQVRFEIGSIGKEIERKLLEELVEESIGDIHR